MSETGGTEGSEPWGPRQGEVEPLTPRDLERYSELAGRLVTMQQLDLLTSDDVQAAALALEALVHEVRRLQSSRPG